MRLAKSLFAGVLVGTATVAAIGSLFVAFSIGSTVQRSSYTDAGGGIGAEVVSVNLAVPLVGGLVAAAAAFSWHWKRGRQKPV